MNGSVAEYLSGMCKALGSRPKIIKRKKRTQTLMPLVDGNGVEVGWSNFFPDPRAPRKVTQMSSTMGSLDSLPDSSPLILYSFRTEVQLSGTSGRVSPTHIKPWSPSTRKRTSTSNGHL